MEYYWFVYKVIEGDEFEKFYEVVLDGLAKK